MTEQEGRLRHFTILSHMARSGNCIDSVNARKLLDEMFDHMKDEKCFLIREGDHVDVIRTTPYDPTPAMRATVIGGCRIIGKNKLPKFAAEKLLEMRPRSLGYYLLVANMYADYNGCWEKVAKIRVSMKE
ncbi:hypothetical protein Tco_0638365 [Tanacetum coccineum]